MNIFGNMKINEAEKRTYGIFLEIWNFFGNMKIYGRKCGSVERMSPFTRESV